MADTNKELYEFLDHEGTLTLAKGILNKVNDRINQRIVQSLDAGDTTHVPSADAVLKAIARARHTTIRTVTGNIDVEVPVAERSTSVLYFQRDDENDTTWMIYIWDANPELDVDPNGRWISLGDTEIDLSGYWSKDSGDIAELKSVLGIDDLKDRVSAVEEALPNKVNYDDLHALTEQEVLEILENAGISTDVFINAATIREALSALVDAGRDSIAFTLGNNLNLTSEGTISIPNGVNATITIPSSVQVDTGNGSAFSVGEGSKLTLKGNGKIVKTGKSTSGAAVAVENGGEVTIDGVTIDCTTQGKADNYAYGVYAKNNSTINFKSGTIKTCFGSGISTNNTTGGSTINVSGGQILCDGSYAIYNPAQGTVNITGGTVQGVNARMGTINISGNAQIIATTIDSNSYDDIGSNISTSGCIWFGDTIALVAGTYTDAAGVDINLNISDDATVTSNFRSAIGVYMVDTNTAANVNVTAVNGDNITTTDGSSNYIEVYDHAYIAAAATAAHKTYNPTVNSTVKVVVNEETVYPV